MKSTPLVNVNGPAHGLSCLAEAIGCQVEVPERRDEITIVCGDAGRSVDLLSDDLPLVRWNLRDFASRFILGQLVQRVDPGSANGGDRKDLVGITSVIDKHATMALFTNPMNCGIDAQRARFSLRILLSGSPMFLDRLCAAGITTSDMCTHPACAGKRCTAEHWFYECPGNQGNINAFHSDFCKVRDGAVRV